MLCLASTRAYSRSHALYRLPVPVITQVGARPIRPTATPLPSTEHTPLSARARAFASSLPIKMDKNVKSPDSSHTAITTHHQYQTSGLERDELMDSPIAQFNKWFQYASENGVPEPEAMTISTVAVDQSTGAVRPSSRVVLLKQVEPAGFVFFSNYESRKGQELAKNPYASLTFYWKELHRSVRVCGKVERLSEKESKAYFDSRPIGSRVGAWASPQSQPISSRSQLEQKVRDIETKFNVPGAAGLDPNQKFDDKQQDQKQIPLPNFWGGYRIVPDEIEFWCGRPNRLHDRFRYTRSLDSGKAADEDSWTINRLAP